MNDPFSDVSKDGTLVTIMNMYSNACNDAAESRGFWDDDHEVGSMLTSEMEEGGSDVATFLGKCKRISLIHSEVSELLEALRTPNYGQQDSEHIPEFTAEAEELADIVIRIFDYAGGYDVELGKAIIAKLEYNETRTHKHGKSF